jgi:hypothetical protein
MHDYINMPCGNRSILEIYNEGELKGKCKCKCGSIFIDRPKLRCKHFSTKKHQEYVIENCERMHREEHPELYEEIPEQLPEIIPEIAKPSIPDVLPEPEPEIITSVDDTPITKAELRKQNKKEYMREYMKKYHAKRYKEDEAYRQYRIEMTNKSTCKMGSRYVKAYQYIKDNNIFIFDENGN